MIKIMHYEWTKLWRSRKNQLVLILFIVSVGAMFFYYQGLAKDYMAKQVEAIDRITLDLQESIKGIDRTLARHESKEKILPEERVAYYQKQLGYLKFEHTQYVMMGYHYKESEPEKQKNILLAQNKLYANRLKVLAEEPTLKEDVLSQMGKLKTGDLEKTLMLNQYILDHKVKLEINPYVLSGAKACTMFFGSWNMLLLCLLSTLMVVDIYLGELAEGSFKLTYTQPYSRKRVYWAKVSVMLLSVVGMFVVALLASILLGTVLNGVGNWTYPMASRVSLFQVTSQMLKASPMLLPLWQYAGFGVLIMVLVVTMAVVITWWISLKTDSSSLAMGGAVLFLTLAFTFALFVSPDSPIYLIYPYMYMGIDQILGVENQGSYLIGLMATATISLLLLLSSQSSFLKKDLSGLKE